MVVIEYIARAGGEGPVVEVKRDDAGSVVAEEEVPAPQPVPLVAVLLPNPVEFTFDLVDHMMVEVIVSVVDICRNPGFRWVEITGERGVFGVGCQI